MSWNLKLDQSETILKSTSGQKAVSHREVISAKLKFAAFSCTKLVSKKKPLNTTSSISNVQKINSRYVLPDNLGQFKSSQSSRKAIKTLWGDCSGKS